MKEAEETKGEKINSKVQRAHTEPPEEEGVPTAQSSTEGRMNGNFLTTKKYKWQEVSDSLQMLPLETVVRAETGEQRVQDEWGKLSLCRRKGEKPRCRHAIQRARWALGERKTQMFKVNIYLMKKQNVREYLFNLGSREKSLRRAICQLGYTITKESCSANDPETVSR